MPVTIQNTPNPNALKFTVGEPVGPPRTFVAGSEVDDEMAGALLTLDGVTSVFMTGDFVTLSKDPSVGWDLIAEPAREIIERHFG
jgi:hypothetical protein